MDILEVRSLKKYYSNHKAVDDISFSIPQGKIFGLLGPNGAGKTTLLRMITGILYPDEGEIAFQGKKFSPATDIIHIGYMPEERGLYKKMKIGEQALYLAMLKGMSKANAMAKIKEWFGKFDMQNWWNKKVGDLSKGMSQKFQFVTTVLHEPDLLILDEPFSGLDPINSNLIKDQIFELSKKGTTIIFSTHRMEQVEEICEKIVLVNKGKKILDGGLKQIKNDFKKHIFRVGFEQEVPGFEAESFNLLNQSPDSWLIHINDGHTPKEVVKEMLNRDIGFVSFNEVLPSLNEIFIRQVNEIKSTPAFSDKI